MPMRPGWTGSPEGKVPPSLPVMFTRSDGKDLLDNLGGATSLSLLGRFSVSAPTSRRCAKTSQPGRGR